MRRSSPPIDGNGGRAAAGVFLVIEESKKNSQLGELAVQRAGTVLHARHQASGKLAAQHRGRLPQALEVRRQAIDTCGVMVDLDEQPIGGALPTYRLASIRHASDWRSRSSAVTRTSP